MAFQDKNLKCQDCGKDFIWSGEDQEFYQTKGFQAPLRCSACRQARKQAPRQMYPATCSGCGAQCEVPFEPRTGRPVFCNTCYRQQREGQPTQVFPSAKSAPQDEGKKEEVTKE